MEEDGLPVIDSSSMEAGLVPLLPDTAASNDSGATASFNNAGPANQWFSNPPAERVTTTNAIINTSSPVGDSYGLQTTPLAAAISPKHCASNGLPNVDPTPPVRHHRSNRSATSNVTTEVPGIAEEQNKATEGQERHGKSASVAVAAPSTALSNTSASADLANEDGKDRKHIVVPKLVIQKPTVIKKSSSAGKLSNKSEDKKSIAEKNLLRPPSPDYLSESDEEDPKNTVSRWSKLRTTVRMATAIQNKKMRKSSSLGRQDSFLKRFSTRHGGGNEDDTAEEEKHRLDIYEKREQQHKKRMRYVVNPDESFMFKWLGVITVVVLYNLWTAIAREAFPEIQHGYETIWFSLDGLADLLYFTDILIQLRTGYLERGLVVYDTKKLANHYLWSSFFYMDCLSLMPLDLIQFYIGIHPIIRFPRFLKVYRSQRFAYLIETRADHPNMWRVANLSHVLFLGSHWFAAFYFMISKAEGHTGHWGYPVPEGEFASVTRKYLKSLYWSTLTLTTIGDLPPPEKNWEYVFTIVSYLIGVFVFATIVGQVGSVITNRNASRQEFERLLDAAKSYMRTHNVPMDMQRRVQRWYDYAWSRGRMNGGGDINSLGLLPDKLKTELAIHVNLETLKKVTIFQECSPEFLHDLVLKMKAFIFTPGDLICRKGEVAREMFIIADGLLEVISESGEVLSKMGAGDFFGEIGILNLDGGVNRRTADVRSVGYSELFVLSRQDVLSALKDHPEAEDLITAYGQHRLQEIEDHKRRRMEERQARLDANTDLAQTSPVHQMIVSSTGLIAQFVNIAKNNNESADDSIQQDGNVQYLQQPGLETCDLLQRVIQLGREQSNQLLLSESLAADVANPDQTTVLHVDETGKNGVNGDTYPQTYGKASSKWTNMLTHRKTGNKKPYTPDDGCEGEDDRLLKDSQSQDALSEEQRFQGITMDTEESDLDMTPDEMPTRSSIDSPDLVNFSHPRSEMDMAISLQEESAIESETRLKTVPNLSHSTSRKSSLPEDITQLQSPQSPTSNLKSNLRKQSLDSAAAGARPHALKSKSVSYANPIFDSTEKHHMGEDVGPRLHASRSENSILPNVPLHLSDLELTAQTEGRRVSLESTVSSPKSPVADDMEFEMTPLKPSLPDAVVSDYQKCSSFVTDAHHMNSPSRRMSKETEDTCLLDNYDDVCSPDVMSEPESFLQLLYRTPTPSMNSFNQHPSSPRASAVSSPGDQHVTSSAWDDYMSAALQPCRSDPGLMHTVPAITSPGLSTAADPEQPLADLMAAMRELLFDRLQVFRGDYISRIQRLESENQQKSQKILQLELQLASLQQASLPATPTDSPAHKRM